MNKIINAMYKSGVFVQRYTGIIEIYPRKAMNSDLFCAALDEISKTHDIVKITNNWLRAFEKKGV